MKRMLKVVFALVVLAGIGAVVWWRLDAGPDSPENRLNLYGNVEMRDAQLSFNEQERLSQVLVEEGDQVTAGQVVARLETARLEAEIEEAAGRFKAQQEVLKRLVNGTRREEIDQLRSEVEAARVRLRNARQNYERLQKTTGAGASSEQALDDARARYEVESAQLKVRQNVLDLAEKGPRQEEIDEAAARLEAQKAFLDLLGIRLRERTLTAPTAGVIQSRILEPGEMAGPGRPVVILALTHPKWVRAYVAEPDLGRIRTGMAAQVFSDSFVEEDFAGRIGFISPVAEFTPKSVETEDLRTQLVYEVRINVQDPRDRLRLGMPVTARVDLQIPPVQSAAGGLPGAGTQAGTQAK